MRVQLGRDVIAQPFRVHADIEVTQRRDAGTARLRHLLAADGNEAMHEDIVRHLQSGEVQHRRPEQRVEVGDVLADEVVLLGRRVGHEGFIVAAGLREIILQRRQVTDRRVQPHVEVLARRIRYLDAEVGRVAADIPVSQARFAVQPFARLVCDFRLQACRIQRPFAQEGGTFRV